VMCDEGDRVRIRNAVVAVTALAWALLWMQSVQSPGISHSHMHHQTMGQSAVSASAAVSWLLMLTAMMAPTLIAPIQLVRGNGLARLRTRSTLLFLAGYTAVWMLAGALVLFLVAVLDRFGFQQYVTTGAVFLIALIWQCSPAKQVCLNRCHTFRAMAAFGRPADAETLAFGAMQGAWCTGSCWAWMLLPFLVPIGHIWLMVAASILIFCERVDEPGLVRWRWRGLGKASRIAAARVKFQWRTSGTTHSVQSEP